MIGGHLVWIGGHLVWTPGLHLMCICTHAHTPTQTHNVELAYTFPNQWKSMGSPYHSTHAAVAMLVQPPMQSVLNITGLHSHRLHQVTHTWDGMYRLCPCHWYLNYPYSGCIVLGIIMQKWLEAAHWGGGYMQALCKYYAILCKILQHVWILISKGILEPWTSSDGCVWAETVIC